MKSVSALALRQSLGRVVASLEKNGPPVLLRKGRKPVAVLISLRDFSERFVELDAAQAREQLLKEMDALIRPGRTKAKAMEVLRALRDA